MEVYSIAINTNQGEIIIPFPKNAILTFYKDAPSLEEVADTRPKLHKVKRFTIEGEYDNLIKLSHQK